MKRTFTILSLLFCGILTNLSSQMPTIQDCLGAIPICQEIYSENSVTSGEGNYPDEVSNVISCLDGEDNGIWYTFKAGATGNFGFLLTPNNLGDDYDWALFDLTNAACDEIFTDPSLLVSCNAAGGQNAPMDCNIPTGANGGTIYNIQGANCGIFPPDIDDGYLPENALIPVVIGNTYVLVVSNWTNSEFGYTIDFGITDVGIFDLLNEGIASNTYVDGCEVSEIELEFNENMQCSSIDPSDFILTGPGGPYSITASSELCDINAPYDDSFTLTISPPITQSGTYTLAVCCILDLCGNEMNLTEIIYDIDLLGDPLSDLEDQSICDGMDVTVDVSSPMASYLWSTGEITSEITITQTGNYTVTITNDCGEFVDDFSVSISDFPSVDLGPDTTLCDAQNLELSVDCNDCEFQWQDGSEDSFLNIDQTGSYSVQAENNCGIDVDTVDILFASEFEIDIPEQIFLCENSYILDLGSLPDVFDVQWQDGTNLNVFTVIDTGLYFVSVDNGCDILLDTTQVDICDICNIYIPNAFSPNNDNINDVFTAYSSCELAIDKIMVFDRWGNMIFETNDDAISYWDGKWNGVELRSGVYTWVMEITLTENGVVQSKTKGGDVQLIR